MIALLIINYQEIQGKQVFLKNEKTDHLERKNIN